MLGIGSKPFFVRELEQVLEKLIDFSRTCSSRDGTRLLVKPGAVGAFFRWVGTDANLDCFRADQATFFKCFCRPDALLDSIVSK